MTPALKQAYDKIVVDTIKKFSHLKPPLSPHYIALILNISTIVTKLASTIQLETTYEEPKEEILVGLNNIFIEISSLDFVVGALIGLTVEEIENIMEEVDKQVFPLLVLHSTESGLNDPTTEH